MGYDGRARVLIDPDRPAVYRRRVTACLSVGRLRRTVSWKSPALNVTLRDRDIIIRVNVLDMRCKR